MDAVGEAMRSVRREWFLPPDLRARAHEDRPLPIGYGATNSQPWTVRYMLALLDVRPGHRVLDVGSGSGWTTALLGHLTGPTGTVLGLDIVAELVAFATANLGDRMPWVRFARATPGVLGAPDAAPFDRILVSADGGSVPESLVAQVGRGGRLVLPAAQEMVVVTRDADGAVHRRVTGDLFSFVPLR